MAKKILIIDDSPTVLEILTSLFKQAGYEAISSDKAQEGPKKAEVEKPDLVIVDTVMPEIDGFEVCRRIREKNDTTKIKIIMMTGSVDAIDAVRARRMGADDYVVKTQDFALLLEAVKKLI